MLVHTVARRSCALLVALPLGLQVEPRVDREVEQATPAASGAEDGALDRAMLRVVAQSTAALLALEENGEWPYESGLRVEGALPMGYRAGGTGVVLSALVASPDLEADTARLAAIARAQRFLVTALDSREMSADILPGFDTRLWGFVYGCAGLLDLRASGVVTGADAKALDVAVETYLDRLVAQELPESGGWAYLRPAGRNAPAPAPSYLTADVLLLLFEAQGQGLSIDPGPIERGLALLEAQRQPSGAFLYKGEPGSSDPATIPGSVGRMVACESVLFLAGRSTLIHVRGALDSFFAHWPLLAESRGRPTYHKEPHGIAPFYFMYAHLVAARAIELLPETDRPEYRRRLAELLLDVRDERGLWNDRVFPRAAGYCTAAAILALLQPALPAVPSWSASAADAESDG